SEVYGGVNGFSTCTGRFRGSGTRVDDVGELQRLVDDHADPGRIDLDVLVRLAQLAGLDDLDCVREVSGPHIDLQAGLDVLGAIHRHGRGDFLEVPRSQEERPRHRDARQGSVDAGAPGAVVADDLPVLVDVDVLSEVVDVARLIADGEEVARDL